MAEALTPLLLLAALLLCIAGIAKLRSPQAASRAFAALGLPSSMALVRTFAAGELALGAWCAVDSGRLAAACVAVLYTAFVFAAALLARNRSACGCFGERDVPASAWQSILSGLLALAALTAVLTPAHGVDWVLDRPPLEAATILIGTAGATYATVLAYTLLPHAWTSWSVQ